MATGLPESLGDATLTSADGCVVLQTDTAQLAICRAAGTSITSRIDLLVASGAWETAITKGLATDPAAPLVHSTVAAPGLGVRGSPPPNTFGSFQTTPQGLVGVPTTGFLTSKDYGVGTSLFTFVAAPSGEMVGIGYLVSPGYRGDAFSEMAQIQAFLVLS